MGGKARRYSIGLLSNRWVLGWRFCGLAQPIWKFPKLLRAALWRTFEHYAFAIAKASAYSCILTFFPALLVLGAVLASSHKFEIYIPEISNALDRMLPTGSATAIEHLRGKGDHHTKFLITTSLLMTVWTASGVVISWMEGFRRAYQLPNPWGLVKERAIGLFARYPRWLADDDRYYLSRFWEPDRESLAAIHRSAPGTIHSSDVDGDFDGCWRF